MIAAAANLLWLASRSGAAVRFRRQLRDPAAAQQERLRDLLRRNAGSAFGRQHGFAGIRTPAEFAARVPLATYDDLEPWIRRIMRGEQAVLTADPVTHLVPTSGSSGARKLIPFTAQLHREFDRAISAWVADLYDRYPAALFGPAYWSISPAARGAATGESAVPVGFEDDTSYLGGASRRLVAAAMAAPAALRDIRDIEAFFVLTLACLLRRRDLRIISVWHPSFLLLLLDALPRHWENVIGILHTGRLPPGLALPGNVQPALRLRPEPARAQELREIGPNASHRFWSRLAVLSCWTDAHATLGATALARRFPGVALQPKGLLATEAFVTLPFDGGHPVAVGSHYFEFIDETGSVHPIEALVAGQAYEVVVTTGGGLWRYRLGDRVQVVGFAARTPALRFIGRAGNVSDLRGEKLTGEFVAQVLRELNGHGREPPRFAMLAPDIDGATGGYILYWEGSAPPPSADLDRRLSANPHYDWCRRLGQLGPARVFVINSGATTAYYERMTASGQKLGDIKLAALANTGGWTGCFHGRLAP